MRRFKARISILLALALVLSLALPARADADPAADVLGRRADETETPDGKTVSIGCLWGDEIRFTYHEKIALSDWDPEALAYRTSSVASSGWTADTDNSIKVSNRSDTGVQIDFRWESEAGYEHVAVGTSESGFRLHAAEYGIEPDSMTVTADVVKGKLEAGQEEYRLMGVLVLGVKAIDDGLVDTVKETMSATSGTTTDESSGAIMAAQGRTVSVEAMPAASVLDGDTYKWDISGDAEILTEAAKGGEPCGEREVDVLIDDDAVGEIVASCAIERASGQRLASSLTLTAYHEHDLTIVSAGEEGHREKCSSCGWEGEIHAHDYDSATDTTCDTCGGTREIYACKVTYPDGTGAPVTEKLKTLPAAGADSRIKNATAVEVYPSVTAIPDETFSECAALESVILPEGLGSIGTKAFYNCEALKSVNLPSTVTSIGERAFQYCETLASPIEIPAGVTRIEDFAFECCYEIPSLTLPDGLASIGEDGFGYCRTLAEIKVPESVAAIELGAFRGCRGIASFKFPDRITTVSNNVLEGCSGLTSIEIPAGVTEIGGCAFDGCSSMTGFDLPRGLTKLGGGAFWNCSSLESIDLPPNITDIGNSTFRNCPKLKVVAIPNKVTGIGYAAFEDSSALEAIYIPLSVTKIKAEICAGCPNVTIHYAGSASRLESVSKDYLWNLQKAPIVYNSPAP